MGTPDNKLSELVDVVKSWIPRRAEPVKFSRDFWMPDQSCRVCYECDSQFTVFNRRHHCRLCGRVFCAKCTVNSIPATFDDQRTTGRDDWERIRVCNYCFKQWEQGVATGDDNGCPSESTTLALPLSPSPSATSLASSKSGCTCNSSCSTIGSTPYSTGPYQRVPYISSPSNEQFMEMDPSLVELDDVPSERQFAETGDPSSTQYTFCMNRSDDEDDDYAGYRSDSEGARHYGNVSVDETGGVYYGPHENYRDGSKAEAKGTGCSSLIENFSTQGMESKDDGNQVAESKPELIHEASAQELEGTDYEPVDYENNRLLWLPPEPEDEEDEREAVLLDDDDCEGATGEWGYLRPSNSFGSGEYRNRDKSIEEHRKAMKNVVEGHFRALIAQLLLVENLPVGGEDGKESWLDIIASLSWEAATILKPDMSKGGGMDPGGYVKVKCIASGHRSESKVVKGVVCKKNVAHRRMTSKIDKPRFLILGGALEYQRVSNHLSSFDTLLQQEMDHLKMAVAKIDAHHPNVVLVEKSVSRYAQEYILAKDISLVLNIKRPLLERIARCTGAQIVPSIDHLTTPKLGYCDSFYVDKFGEEHGSAGQGGKKLTKTLMFFDGCPKPFGCTVLLKGANGDELKKVKHVVQYGVFAAYHLALETSFLADEGASLPELPLKSPITVALPDKPSSIERSISTIPGFPITPSGKPPNVQTETEVQNPNKAMTLNGLLSENLPPSAKSSPCSWSMNEESASRLTSFAAQLMSYPLGQDKVGIGNEFPLPEENKSVGAGDFALMSSGSFDDLAGIN
ncbi:hypothetical protein CRG98_003578, partial [Punica granatum]